MKTHALRRAAARTLAALAVLALLAYGAWSHLTAPRGEQAVTFTPAAQTCGTIDGLDYCINRQTGPGPGPGQGDLIYHLHGRRLNAQSWNDPTYFTAMVQGEWQRLGLPAPTVVTLSYGPEWLLTPSSPAARSGLLDRIGPQIDRLEAQIGPPRRRLLVGESMGGLNALVLGLSQPDRFDKIAALCPGVYVDSPFASLDTLRAALQRTGADPKIALGVWWLARQHIAHEADWARVSPLSLLETLAHASKRPALYLSCGLYDRYGNFEGTQQLATRARELGIPTDWHPLYGGHCAIDITSLARFLAS